MPSIRSSAFGFIRGAWGAIIFAFAAITDPLAIAKMIGLVDASTEWTLGETAMRYLFVTVAIGWAFVWYHQVRKHLEWKDPQPNLSLHEACRWIVRDSVWAENYNPALDDEWPVQVYDEVMSKLLMGRIEMFGRRRESAKSNGPMQHVRPADKERLEWDYRKLAHDEPPTHMYVPGGVVYTAVQLDRDQVHRVWPRKSLRARLMRNSPVQRIGEFERLFAQQDAYYRRKFGFSPTPLQALVG